MDDLNKDGTYVLRAKHFVVKINGSLMHIGIVVRNAVRSHSSI